MFPQDLPDQLHQQVSAILGCDLRPSADLKSVLLEMPMPVSDAQARQLRELKLAVQCGSETTLQLVHVWETYQRQLPPRTPAKYDHWEIQNINIVADRRIMYYDQLTPALHIRHIPPGAATVLNRIDPQDGTKKVWMSTAPLELATLSDSLEECRGHVLVAGLGLGIFPALAIQKPAVKTVTVIENDPGIIALTEPYIQNPRIKVIEQDAWTMTERLAPAAPFDYCFFDIWPDIQDPFREEEKAKAAVSPLMADNGVTTVWCQALNDRKRATIRKVVNKGPALAQIAPAGMNCYQCAEEATCHIDGLCPVCCYFAWLDNPATAHSPYPIPPSALPVPPEDIPEFQPFIRASQILDSIPPETWDLLKRFQEQLPSSS